ncbi:hypothetical protein [Peribacillus muralis]|uniref:hypothetical protein n=1 Tax=Peribacillus muralis TaxID=264697 RepID=UPI003671F5AF
MKWILQIYGQWECHLHVQAKWNETEGGDTPAGNAVYVRPRRRKAEKAQGPPLDKGAPAVQ